MSRIGKKIIIIPENVSVEISDGEVLVRGPKGELRQLVPAGVKIVKTDGKIRIETASGEKTDRAVWGTTRSLVANMVKGVLSGYEKKLEIEGIGFKAQVQGNKLVLNLGFSHSTELVAPSGISFKVEKNTIIVSGTDKTLVGEVAARIRGMKKPEPYKGKGIKYQGELIRRKSGKKATSTA